MKPQTPHWMRYVRPIKVDCSYPELHAKHHHLHPDPHPQQEARLVCYLCHTPALELPGGRRLHPRREP